MAISNGQMLRGPHETLGAPWFQGKITSIEKFAQRRAPTSERRPDNVVSFDLHDLQSETGALGVRFEEDLGSLWCTFHHDERPCFTPQLLEAIRRLQTRLKRGLSTPALTGRVPLRSVVWTSAAPGIL